MTLQGSATGLFHRRAPNGGEKVAGKGASKRKKLLIIRILPGPPFLEGVAREVEPSI